MLLSLSTVGALASLFVILVRVPALSTTKLDELVGALRGGLRSPCCFAVMALLGQPDVHGLSSKQPAGRTVPRSGRLCRTRLEHGFLENPKVARSSSQALSSSVGQHGGAIDTTTNTIYLTGSIDTYVFALGPAAVPEPASIVLLATGPLGLATFRRSQTPSAKRRFPNL